MSLNGFVYSRSCSKSNGLIVSNIACLVITMYCGMLTIIESFMVSGLIWNILELFSNLGEFLNIGNM